MSAHSTDYRRFLGSPSPGAERSRTSQVQVARRLGKRQSFVSKCESGERRVDVVELATLARLYGRPVTWFLK